MSGDSRHRIADLVERLVNGTISDVEFVELETSLVESSEARRLYLDLTHQHATLATIGDSLVREELDVAPAQRWRAFTKGSLATAACLVVGFLFWWQASRPVIVATLVSSEYAAWESSTPTTPGTQLPAGFLKLKAGVATIRFRSGAQVVLQAPAHLVLETPMRGKLLFGSAVVTVPDSAIGFVVDTPNGYAVDHGTEFAVSVDEEGGQSTFEVLSGEISVSQEGRLRAVRLTENQLAVATKDSINTPTEWDAPADIARERNVVRLNTTRETSIVRHDERDVHLDPELLMTKSRGSGIDGSFDRRSLVRFDVSTIDTESLRTASLHLNLVPTGLGHAAYLPRTNTFAVYGVIDEQAEDWAADDLRWQDAPRLDQCRLLGTFDVPRGVQAGSFSFGNADLVEFLRTDADKHVSFVLVRQTGELRRQGLVHAFAGSNHPRATGPTLDVVLR